MGDCVVRGGGGGLFADKSQLALLSCTGERVCAKFGSVLGAGGCVGTFDTEAN